MGGNSPSSALYAKFATYMDPPSLSRGIERKNTIRNRSRHISDLFVKGSYPFGP
jgi:hypothetical protein